LIFDEVITGFRVGPGGAQARYGVRPDLTTLGKIIGGGMPIGAYGGRRDLMDLVAPLGSMYQAGTLSGHALSMAAGCATLDLLSDDAYVALEDAGGRLAAGLGAAATAAGRAVAVSRVGSLLTLYFLVERPIDAAQALTADRKAYAAFFGAMLDDGVLLPPSPFESWFLSLAHDDAVIDTTIAAARRAFAA
jgi:glutamate-1-semialdehyde 2,1-aminomutase